MERRIIIENYKNYDIKYEGNNMIIVFKKEEYEVIELYEDNTIMKKNLRGGKILEYEIENEKNDIDNGKITFNEILMRILNYISDNYGKNKIKSYNKLYSIDGKIDGYNYNKYLDMSFRYYSANDIMKLIYELVNEYKIYFNILIKLSEEKIIKYVNNPLQSNDLGKGLLNHDV